MQVSYNLTQGLGAVDLDAPGSYNTSLYPFVTFNEAKQIEREVASQYGELSINAISANEDRVMGAGMTMKGKYRKGTAGLASDKLALRLYNLNAQKQKMAVDAAQIAAQTQMAEAQKAAAQKAQADTLVALQSAGIITQKQAAAALQQQQAQNTAAQNQTDKPAEKTGMSTQTKLMIGGTLLTLAAITTIAVVKIRNNKNNANKKRNGY